MTPPSFFRIAQRQVWFFVTLIFLLVAGGMLAGGLVTLGQEQRYELGGEKTVGRVTAKYTERRGSGRNRRTHYILRYQFSTPDGFEIDGQASVRRSTWEEFNEGDSVPVEYLRSEPETSRIVGDNNLTEGTILAGIGGAGLLVVGFFFRRSLKQVLTARRIWQEGRRGEGTVTDVRETNLSSNRVKQWKIRYEYLDLTGRKHSGSSNYLPPAEARDWRVGDRGVILYDKEQPELSVWVGREEKY